MAKAKITKNAQPVKPAQTQHEPVPTPQAYTLTFWVIVVGFLTQLVMAGAAYGSLPSEIPSSWIGWAQPGGTLPKSIIFLAFPGAQVVVFLMAWFSAKDSEGRKVMDSGKAISLILLAALFTILQASAFTIPH